MSLFSAKAVVVKKNVGIPVYALDWQDDTTIIASGGGGVGKSGVKNKLVWIAQDSRADVLDGGKAGRARRPRLKSET